jgi:hypothetical protein
MSDLDQLGVTLTPGETVIYQTPRGAELWLRVFLIWAVLIFSSLVLVGIGLDWALEGQSDYWRHGVIFSLVLGPGFLYHSYPSHVILTDRRIIFVEGIKRRRIGEIALNDIRRFSPTGPWCFGGMRLEIHDRRRVCLKHICKSREFCLALANFFGLKDDVLRSSVSSFYLYIFVLPFPLYGIIISLILYYKVGYVYFNYIELLNEKYYPIYLVSGLIMTIPGLFASLFVGYILNWVILILSTRLFSLNQAKLIIFLTLMPSDSKLKSKTEKILISVLDKAWRILYGLRLDIHPLSFQVSDSRFATND